MKDRKKIQVGKLLAQNSFILVFIPYNDIHPRQLVPLQF